jgi:hypothetical protein
VSEAVAFLRFAAGLRGFLRTPQSVAEARALVSRGLEARDARFLRVLERGIYANPASPVRRLLVHAGAELGDVAGLVRSVGLERTLHRLHDEGVYVSIEEFKGLRPIERPGLTLEVTSESFDNPLLAAAYAHRTGGSRGAGRRIKVDLGYVEHETAYDWLVLDAHDALPDRPTAIWRPVPPGVAGLKNALRFAKRRIPVEHWFSQTPLSPRGRAAKDYVLAVTVLAAARQAGARIPWPDHVPPAHAGLVARWLARHTACGVPGLLSTPASSAVRACLAARDAGLDIGGSILRIGGEPYTEGKERVVAGAGCRTIQNYAMGELGRVGLHCARPAALDDFHLAADILAVIQRSRSVGSGGERVGTFLFTNVHPASPKLFVNFECDDYGVLEERACGCALGELGLTTHLHTIRSHEKLTSEGMTYLGSDVIRLVEDVLPARFGGAASDYQLVEQEVDGIPRVTIVVSPRLGEVDGDQVVATTLRELGSGPAYRAMMAAVLASAGTMSVVRREPYVTRAAKIPPLHLLDAAGR